MWINNAALHNMNPGDVGFHWIKMLLDFWWSQSNSYGVNRVFVMFCMEYHMKHNETTVAYIQK